MWNYKIVMATFCKSQCQDGDEVSTFYEWQCQGIKHALENLNTRKSTFRRILTGILSRHSKNSEILNLSAKIFRAWSSLSSPERQGKLLWIGQNTREIIP